MKGFEAMNKISFDDFNRVDIRVGTIVEVKDYPEARKPSLKIEVDFGEEIGRLKSSAQLKKNYTMEGLLGRQVAGVVNFPSKQIGRFLSEFLVLGFPDEEGDVVLVIPERGVPNGGKLF